ncbi:MAG: serine/threonine-protein kinase [Pseudomonadota bacterium]
MDNTVAPLEIGLELGPEFRVQKKLGQGGFGITYLVTALIDIDDRIREGAFYVVKEFAVNGYVSRASDSNALEPVGNTKESRSHNWEVFTKWRDSFMQEARTMAKFHHKNIVEVFLIREANNTVYIIMEYVDGQPLATRIDNHIATRKYGLEWQELEPIVGQMLNALEYIHDRNVIHRDIKPDNIMLRANGDAVLIDFGGARTADKAKTSVVYTPGFAPAEQWRPDALPKGGDPKAMEIGPATDIYSMAAAFYSALSGRAPYFITEDNAIGQNPSLFGHALTSHWKLPPEAAKAIDAALSFDDPTKRPQNVQIWREALNAAPDHPQHQDALDKTKVNPVRVGETVPLPEGQGDTSAASISLEQATMVQESIKRSRRSNTIGLGLAGLASVAAIVLLALANYTDLLSGENTYPYGVQFTVDQDWIPIQTAILNSGQPLPGLDSFSPKKDLTLPEVLAEAETNTFVISSTDRFGVRYQDAGKTRVVIVSVAEDFPMVSAAQLAELEVRAIDGDIRIRAANTDFLAWQERQS